MKYIIDVELLNNVMQMLANSTGTNINYLQMTTVLNQLKALQVYEECSKTPFEACKEKLKK